jgi:hypothetical protein
VPKRRKARVPLHLRAVSAGGALLVDLWGRATARPIDFAAILLGTTMSAVIVVNALYLQTGSRSAAPYFTPPVAAATPPAGASLSTAQAGAQATGTTAAKPTEQIIATRPVAGGAIAAQPVSVRHDDPIADLIAPQPSPKVTAVQRALAEYGYGQIKPTGFVDEPTSAAISRFERDHKLPVTGRVSERLVSQLTALVGHPLN